MTHDFDCILAKSMDKGVTPLMRHLDDVARIAVLIAENLNLDKQLAFKGGVLHDIGKVSPTFQETLKQDYVRQPGFVWRHEIASLFFLQLVPEEEWAALIDMIVAHHKSVRNDISCKGLLDLEDNYEDCFERHAKNFELWKKDAVSILAEFGIKGEDVTLERARECYNYAIAHCEEKDLDYSLWKGMLMSADHMASALEESNADIPNIFIKPDLSFYNRQSDLHPLSLISTDDSRMHTLVTAPTGAGKTDFLLRRCRGRVFYTLPYQASINAMYDRIKCNLSQTDARVTLLHSTSNLKMKNGQIEERIMQRMVGASVKVMTPHQMASIIFGIKGYEAMLADLKGCDVILDEIHTYTSAIQATVLRIIEVLVDIGCRVHVGTATMPKILYDKILELLGGNKNVYEVSLPKEMLGTFDRHIIHKVCSFDDCALIIENAVKEKQKLLIVCNQVKRAQSIFEKISKDFPNIKKMMIHSRYKRGDRCSLESSLQNTFNICGDGCIVVSTQVVEVSLDISFDVMITECAPIDAMVQRFGRINRKRTKDTIGKYKNIYVIAPPENEDESKPYDSDVLAKSYEVLPNDDVLHESSLQTLIDNVYPEILDFVDIDCSGVIFADGEWCITELYHYSKSAFLNLLDINSATCIVESDKERYKNSGRDEAMMLEIPVSYRSIAYRHLEQIEHKARPYIIPDIAYDKVVGLLAENLTPSNYKQFEIL